MTEARPMPFSEALEKLVPAHLWEDFERAAADCAAEPERPSYWGMSAGEWRDASEQYARRRSIRRTAAAEAEAAMQRIVEHLIDRLAAGELTGIVQDNPPFGGWRTIPALAWRAMEPLDLGAGHFRAGKTELRSVLIVEGRYEPAVEIVASGSAGRPTSRQLYMGEFRRRCEAGAVASSLRAEAGYLAAWMKQHHPGAPGADARTIANNIRADYRARFPQFGR